MMILKWEGRLGGGVPCEVNRRKEPKDEHTVWEDSWRQRITQRPAVAAKGEAGCQPPAGGLLRDH